MVLLRTSVLSHAKATVEIQVLENGRDLADGAFGLSKWLEGQSIYVHKSKGSLMDLHKETLRGCFNIQGQPKDGLKSFASAGLAGVGGYLGSRLGTTDRSSS